MSRDAPTTQICSPTAQNTQKPTHKGGCLRPPPQRGAGAFSARPPVWIPLWVLVFVYFGLLGYISVLSEHFLTLFPYKLSRAEPSRRLFTWTRSRLESWQIKPCPTETGIRYFPTVGHGFVWTPADKTVSNGNDEQIFPDHWTRFRLDPWQITPCPM